MGDWEFFKNAAASVDGDSSDWDWEEAPAGRGHPQDRPDDDDSWYRFAAEGYDKDYSQWHDLGWFKDALNREYNVRFKRKDNTGQYLAQALDPRISDITDREDDDAPVAGVIKWSPHSGEIAWRGSHSAHRGGFLSMFLKDHLMKNLPSGVVLPHHSDNLTTAGRASLNAYYDQYGDPHGDIEPVIYGYDDDDDDDDRDYYYNDDNSDADDQEEETQSDEDEKERVTPSQATTLTNHGFSEDRLGHWEKQFSDFNTEEPIERHTITPDGRLQVDRKNADGQWERDDEAGSFYNSMSGALQKSRRGFAERHLPSYGWTPHYRREQFEFNGVTYPADDTTTQREAPAINGERPPYKWTKTTEVHGDVPYTHTITMPEVGEPYHLYTTRKGHDDNLTLTSDHLSDLQDAARYWEQGKHPGGRRDFRLTHNKLHNAVKDRFGQSPGSVHGSGVVTTEPVVPHRKADFATVPYGNDQWGQVNYNWDTGRYSGRVDNKVHHIEGTQPPLISEASVSPIKTHVPWADLMGLSKQQSAFQRTHPHRRQQILTNLLQAGDLATYDKLLPIHRIQGVQDRARAKEGRRSPYAHPSLPQPWDNPTGTDQTIYMPRYPQSRAEAPTTQMRSVRAAFVDEYSVHPDEIGYLKARDFYDIPLHERPWENTSPETRQAFEDKVLQIMESAQHEGIREPVDVQHDRMHNGAHRWEAARRLGIELPIRRTANVDDLADELRSNGAEVNGDGTVVVYHHTSPELAQAIHDSGRMHGNEDGVFFTTRGDQDAQGGNRGGAVVKLQVPLSALQLDDVFGDEAHVRVPTRRAGDQVDVSQWLREAAFDSDKFSDDDPATPSWREVGRNNRDDAEGPLGEWEQANPGKVIDDKRLMALPYGYVPWLYHPAEGHEWPEESGRYPTREDISSGVVQPMVGIKETGDSADVTVGRDAAHWPGRPWGPGDTQMRDFATGKPTHEMIFNSDVDEHGEPILRSGATVIADESGLKAAGIAVIAMDTGRVLMQQRALNPMMCPCGMGVTWDEMNGYQHDDGSVSHDNSDLSVSEMLDQGHDTDGLVAEAALEYDPNEGTWEFPGGKLDEGESSRSAAIREFREEVGQDLPPGVFVGAWLSPGGLVVHAAREQTPAQIAAQKWLDENPGDFTTWTGYSNDAHSEVFPSEGRESQLDDLQRALRGDPWGNHNPHVAAVNEHGRRLKPSEIIHAADGTEAACGTVNNNKIIEDPKKVTCTRCLRLGYGARFRQGMAQSPWWRYEGSVGFTPADSEYWQFEENSPAYAVALMGMDPSLRFGSAGYSRGRDSEGEWVPQHHFAHNDDYYFDSRGRHPLDHLEPNYDVIQLEGVADDWGPHNKNVVRAAVQHAMEHKVLTRHEHAEHGEKVAPVRGVTTDFPVSDKHDLFQRLNRTASSPIIPVPEEHERVLLNSGWVKRHPELDSRYPDFTKDSPNTGVHHQVIWDHDGSGKWFYDATIPDLDSFSGYRVINASDPRRAFEGKGGIPLDIDQVNDTAKQFDRDYLLGGPYENGVMHHFEEGAEPEYLWMPSEISRERSRLDEGADPVRGTHTQPDVSYRNFSPFTHEYDTFGEDPHAPGGIAKLNSAIPYGDDLDFGAHGWDQNEDLEHLFEKNNGGFYHRAEYHPDADSPTGHSWILASFADGHLIGGAGSDYGHSTHPDPGSVEAKAKDRERQWVEEGLRGEQFGLKPVAQPFSDDTSRKQAPGKTRPLNISEMKDYSPLHPLNMQRLNAADGWENPAGWARWERPSSWTDEDWPQESALTPSKEDESTGVTQPMVDIRENDFKDLFTKEWRPQDAEHPLHHNAARIDVTPAGYPEDYRVWQDSEFPITPKGKANHLNQPMVGIKGDDHIDLSGDVYRHPADHPICETCYDNTGFPFPRSLHQNYGGIFAHDFVPMEPGPGERRFAAAGRTTTYHLTDNPRFKLDETFAPEDNSLSINPRDGRRGLYVGEPERWASPPYNYKRPYVVELSIPTGTKEGGRWGGENFIPADKFADVKVERVMPYDHYIRREWGVPGDTEEHHSQTYDTGEPLKNPGSFSNNNYREGFDTKKEIDTRDPRQWSDEQHFNYLKQRRQMLHDVHGWGWNEFNDDGTWATPPDSDYDGSGELIRRDKHGAPMTREKRASKVAAKAPVYKGFIYLIQNERDIDLTKRELANPDDPDGDMSEQSAWWDIEHAKANPALRQEVKDSTPWDELELWADKSVRSNREVKEAFARLAKKDYPKNQKCHYCKSPCTKRITHSEGMAYIPVCDSHLQKGKSDAAACVPYGGSDPSNIDSIREAMTKQADVRPPLPDGLEYIDREDRPWQNFTDDEGTTNFWRWHDPTLVAPKNPNDRWNFSISHGNSVDPQPMMMLKDQIPPPGQFHDESMTASWNDPFCETCYLQRGFPVRESNHPETKGHPFKPMLPDTDALGNLRQASLGEHRDERPKIHPSLQYVDESNRPFDTHKDDEGKTKFWRYQDPEFVPPLDEANPERDQYGDNESHHWSVNVQPMMMIKPQSDYDNEESFNRGISELGGATRVKWTDPYCETCYLRGGNTVNQGDHDDFTKKLLKDRGIARHPYKPMVPDTDEHGALKQAATRPELPEGLRYIDAEEKPWQTDKDDQGTTEFWRYQDTEHPAPKPAGMSHNGPIDVQPMMVIKPQSDYEDAEDFEAGAPGNLERPQTEVRWNDPLCETCYLTHNDMIPANKHPLAMTVYKNDMGHEPHEFKPMVPEVDQSGRFRESSVKTAVPLTQDTPYVNKVLRAGDLDDSAGEGARVHDVTLPSGNWMAKSMQHRHLTDPRYMADPLDRDYFHRRAIEDADMEEFASRLGHALSNVEEEPITPQVVRGRKKSDPPATVYVRKYPDFHDAEDFGHWQMGEHHFNTPRGKLMGYFHAILGAGDHENYHNVGLLGDRNGVLKDMTPVSIDHTHSSLGDYAKALANKAEDPGQERYMRWHHEFGLSPLSSHYIGTGGDGWPARKNNNPLGTGDTERALEASETLRPWAKVRGREDWLDALQHRQRLLGRRATFGGPSLFPYTMPHEEGLSAMAATNPPARKRWPAIRQTVTTGRPEYTLRAPDEVSAHHHDTIMDAERPDFREEPDLDATTPRIYAVRNHVGGDQSRHTFLAPVYHNETGEDGWLRGVTSEHPSTWKFYHDDDLVNAIRGSKPGQTATPSAAERYTRGYPRGHAAPNDVVEREKAQNAWREGDLDLDDEGHQIVEPWRDTWADLGALRGFAEEPDYEAEDKPWSDADWTGMPEPGFVKERYKNASVNHWWTFA